LNVKPDLRLATGVYLRLSVPFLVSACELAEARAARTRLTLVIPTRLRPVDERDGTENSDDDSSRSLSPRR
jgi:hypothetical protein